MLFFVFFVAGKNLILKTWFSILGFQMKCFFWGDVDPKSLLQKKRDAERGGGRRNHGTKPGSIERGRLRRVLEQSGNHGFVSAGRVERDGKKIGGGWFDVTVFGIAPLAGTKDVRGFVCRRRRRRRLVVCFLPGFGGALFYAGEVSSFAGGVVSLPFLSLLLSFRRDVYRRDGKQVRRSPSVRSTLSPARGSNRKVDRNISLFFLSNRYAANYKEQEKLDHRF